MIQMRWVVLVLAVALAAGQAVLPTAELAPDPGIAFESGEGSEVALAGLLRNTLNHVQHAHPVIDASCAFMSMHLQSLL